MPTFQPSQFSCAQQNPLTDFIPQSVLWIPGVTDFSKTIVGRAVTSVTGSGAEPSAAPATETLRIEVFDDQGAKFSVRSNGRIEVLSGYPNVGTIFAPGDSGYNTLVRNLATLVPGNREKIEKVLGKEKVDAAISAAQSYFASVPVAQPGEGALPSKKEDVSLTQKPWFWPTVVITTSGVAALAIVFWPRR